MANQTKGGAAEAIGGFFKAIGGFFSGFGTAVAKGDLFVKLSLLWWGAGYARRKQYIKAVIMTALEAAVILFTIFFAMDYVPKFGSLGTVKAEKVFNPDTMKSEFNNYDHSFKILLFSLFSFVVWFAAIIVWMKNMMNVYKLQKMDEAGEHINTFEEDLKTYVGEKFHITLLTLPVLGVSVFTLRPEPYAAFTAFLLGRFYELYHPVWRWRADINFWLCFCPRSWLDSGMGVFFYAYYLYRWYFAVPPAK